jgi:hypothetical protein
MRAVYFPECVCRRSFCLRDSGAVAPSAPLTQNANDLSRATLADDTTPPRPVQERKVLFGARGHRRWITRLPELLGG